MGLLFSPNLFFLKSFALLRKSGLYFLTIILTFSLKSTGKWWRKSATFFITCVDEDGNVTCTGMKLSHWTTLSRNKMLCKMGMCPIIQRFLPLGIGVILVHGFAVSLPTLDRNQSICFVAMRNVIMWCAMWHKTAKANFAANGLLNVAVFL